MDLLAAGCIIPRMGEAPITFILIYYENHVTCFFYLLTIYVVMYVKHVCGKVCVNVCMNLCNVMCINVCMNFCRYVRGAR